MLSLLDAGGDVRDIEDAWFFLHSLFEKVWDHRFLYRDLNHLLSGNRHLETHFRAVLDRKTQALRQMLLALASAQAMQIDIDHIDSLSTAMAVMLTYWLSYEYVRDPRHAMEPESASLAMGRGAQQVLGLLTPYLASPELQQHLRALTSAYARQTG